MERESAARRRNHAASSPDGWTLIPSFNILHKAALMLAEFSRPPGFNGSLIFNADRHHRRARA